VDVVDEWFETALRARRLARFDCASEEIFDGRPSPRTSGHEAKCAARSGIACMSADATGVRQPFLSDIVTVLDHCGHHIGLQTQYSIDAFSRSLFDIYEVDFPTRLGNAVPKRQGEFLAGRVLAGAALKSLGIIESSVGIGERGAPLWPKGSVGSISHSHGRCACLVARGENMLIGIDVEKVATGNSLEAIMKEALSARECNRLAHQTCLDQAILATTIFSAKETIFKALYPVVQGFFGFDAVSFNGIEDEDTLSFSTEQTLHPTIPIDTKMLIKFETDNEFTRTWTIIDRTM